MRTVTYSDARNTLRNLCDEVREAHKPVRIHRKGGDVVLVSAEDWDALQETLYLASLPGALERIKFADDYRALEDLSADGLKALIAED